MGKINGGNRRLRAEAKVSKGWIARSLIAGRSPAKLQRVLEIAGVIPGGWSTICQSRSAVTGPGSRRQCCQAPIFNVSAHLASMRVPPKALSPVSKSIPLFSLPPNLNNSVYTISLFQSSELLLLTSSGQIKFPLYYSSIKTSNPLFSFNIQRSKSSKGTWKSCSLARWGTRFGVN